MLGTSLVLTDGNIVCVMRPSVSVKVSAVEEVTVVVTEVLLG